MIESTKIKCQCKGAIYFSIGPGVMVLLNVYLCLNNYQVPIPFFAYTIAMVVASYCVGYLLIGYQFRHQRPSVIALSVFGGVFWGFINFIILESITLALRFINATKSLMAGSNQNLRNLPQINGLIIGFIVSSVFIFVPLCWFLLIVIHRQWLALQKR